MYGIDGWDGQMGWTAVILYAPAPPPLKMGGGGGGGHNKNIPPLPFPAMRIAGLAHL